MEHRRMEFSSPLPADLQRVPEMLRRRGYTEVDVEGIMYGNWVRFFRETWSRR